MNATTVIPSWVPLILLAMSVVSLINALVAVQVSYYLNWKQTCPLLSAALSFSYIFLSLDLYAYALANDISASLRHLAWLGAAIFTLLLTIASTRTYVAQVEAYKKLGRAFGALKKRSAVKNEGVR